MIEYKRYVTLLKGDSLIDYAIQPFKDEIQKRVDDAYQKLLNDNELNPSLHRKVCQCDWMGDNFINNEFSIMITAIPIK